MMPTDPGEASLLAKHLPAEPVVWTGRPDPGRVALIASTILVFAIPWTVFALFWEGTVLSLMAFADWRGAPDGLGRWMMPVMAVFGLPFVVIGLGMCAAPLIAAWRAGRTLYAITRRRLVVLRRRRRGGVELESYAGADIHGLHLSSKADGSGDLVVTVGWTRDSDGDRMEKKVEMRGVADAQRAHDALEGSGSLDARPCFGWVAKTLLG